VRCSDHFLTPHFKLRPPKRVTGKDVPVPKQTSRAPSCGGVRHGAVNWQSLVGARLRFATSAHRYLFGAATVVFFRPWTRAPLAARPGMCATLREPLGRRWWPSSYDAVQPRRRKPSWKPEHRAPTRLRPTSGAGSLAGAIAPWRPGSPGFLVPMLLFQYPAIVSRAWYGSANANKINWPTAAGRGRPLAEVARPFNAGVTNW